MATSVLDFSHLTPDERLQLVEDLWDSLALGSPEAVPVAEWHVREVERRLAAYRRDGDRGRPWQEVLDEIDAGLGRQPG
ncbi:antitoxin [Gemmatimonadetes bacterium T265]|nr:antitoxin [Gemmatimonadetes bacterium T265]